MTTMIDRSTNGTAGAQAGAEGRLPQASPGVDSARGAALLDPQCSAGERSEPERNEGANNAELGGMTLPSTVVTLPDPEVSDRPRRRRFTAEYKRRILRLADAGGRGEIAALLRREGLYSSHLTAWRKERKQAELQTLAPKKRGPKLTKDPALVIENQRLQRDNRQLQRRLDQAQTIIEFQKKVSELLGIPLKNLDSDENA